MTVGLRSFPYSGWRVAVFEGLRVDSGEIENIVITASVQNKPVVKLVELESLE